MKKLTGGQIAVLTGAFMPMLATGVIGGIGTYSNIGHAYGKGTALGALGAGEGATAVLALVLLGLTMLGQSSPRAVRAGLWLLPAAAACMGAMAAPDAGRTVIYALTPMGMSVSAEGMAFLARRIVVYRTDADVEAQRRNAAVLRQIAYHRARAARHPWKWVQKRSTLKVWRLLSRAGEGDVQLGAGLVTVQRERLTEGADDALGELLTGIASHPELPPAHEAVSPEPSPTEPELIDFETTVDTALGLTAPTPYAALPAAPPLLPEPALTLPDQQVSREPVLSPAELTTVSTPEPSPETASEPGEPEDDEIEQQITTLAHRLRSGERLTKTTAAQLLGVSPATAGRRLKDARGRINDGTGMYL